MRPNNDSQNDDAQLRGLLREWRAPETPPSLEQRVLGSLPSQSQPWWRFLFSGYIRVPVYVAYVLAILLMLGAWRVAVQPPAPCVAAETAAPAHQVTRTLPPNTCDHAAPGVC
jgi:hypothetical protein